MEQLWVLQSSLLEVCRNNLWRLPLVPGRIFRPAAQEALDRHVPVSETRSCHVGTASGTPFNNVGVRPTYRSSQHFHHLNSRKTPPPPPPPRRGGTQPCGHQSHIGTPRSPASSPHLYRKAFTGALMHTCQKWAVSQKVN